MQIEEPKEGGDLQEDEDPSLESSVNEQIITDA